MKKASVIMIIGATLLLGLYFFPLWHIQLVAPQYPEGLGMYIHFNDIKGEGEFDIQNIDGLNHYIGMKTIPKADEMWELKYFPIIAVVLSATGILLGILGFFGKIHPNFFLIWFIVASTLGILGIYDFNLWLLDYGSDLDPTASIQLLDEFGEPMIYKPPLLGYQKLLNFDVESWPRAGGYLMGLSFIMSFIAYYVGIKSPK